MSRDDATPRLPGDSGFIKMMPLSTDLLSTETPWTFGKLYQCRVFIGILVSGMSYETQEETQNRSQTVLDYSFNALVVDILKRKINKLIPAFHIVNFKCKGQHDTRLSCSRGLLKCGKY